MRANDSILATEGSGATLAMHSPSGSGTTRYQCQVLADPAGQVRDQTRTYRVQTPNLLYAQSGSRWEIFNGSAFTVLVLGFTPQLATETAVGGGVSVRFDIWRTTAVGSGGTFFNTESSSTLSANASRYDTGDTAWPSGLTIQTALTSITTGAWLMTVNHTRNELVADSLSASDPVFGGVGGFHKEFKLRSGEGLAARELQSGGTHSWIFDLMVVP